MVSISSPSSCRGPEGPAPGQPGGCSMTAPAGPAQDEPMSSSPAGSVVSGPPGSCSPTGHGHGLDEQPVNSSCDPPGETGCTPLYSPRRFSTTEESRGLPTADKAVSEPVSPRHASSRGMSRLSCTPDASRGASRLSSVAATSSENGPRWSVSGSVRRQQVRNSQKSGGLTDLLAVEPLTCCLWGLWF